MDFGTLLHVAKKNSETEKNESKYYSTKFAPPKKESKEKKLSANIQKFLQKREQEEKERQRVEREKLANLLAKRDEKSKNKIKKMLKVTKSANKSVLEDAINSEHTAVTMQGPDQPDQDDYGYVSNEANAFYQKYIEKVKDVKEDKGFAPSRPQSLKDLTGTKERVKAAITKEIEEKKSHTRQRMSSSTTTASNSSVTATLNTATVNDSNSAIARAYSKSKSLFDPEEERREDERKKREEDQKRLKNRKPLPPPMDFQALLKLAEKKQHEPVEIIPEVKKKKEPERLLTSKEKRELEERMREREARERRQRERSIEIPKNRCKEQERRKEISNAGRMETNGRIPKLNEVASKSTVTSTSVTNTLSTKISSTASTMPSSAQSSNNGFKKPIPPSPAHSQLSRSTAIAKATTSSLANTHKSLSISTKSGSSSSALNNSSNSNKNFHTASSSSKNQQNAREFPPRDAKAAKPRQQTSDLQKARQFPPPDIRKECSSKLSESRKPQSASKRRILDDDEDEYDSDLDDFIDDGDEEEDYSSHIKAIFGYDKARYKDLDDEDDAAMESNFAQVQREEYISKKIGIQEDLEDMKLEAMEKKRKMVMKKRKL